jgi:hypothetical protein
MRRILLVLTVAAMMAALMMSLSGVALAQGGDVCVSVKGEVRADSEGGPSDCFSDSTSLAVAVNNSTAVALANSKAKAINNSQVFTGDDSKTTAINDSDAFALFNSEATAINDSTARPQ